eukprot:Gb_16310 [translate_table: standard]
MVTDLDESLPAKRGRGRPKRGADASLLSIGPGKCVPDGNPSAKYLHVPGSGSIKSSCEDPNTYLCSPEAQDTNSTTAFNSIETKSENAINTETSEIAVGSNKAEKQESTRIEKETDGSNFEDSNGRKNSSTSSVDTEHMLEKQDIGRESTEVHPDFDLQTRERMCLPDSNDIQIINDPQNTSDTHVLKSSQADTNIQKVGKECTEDQMRITGTTRVGIGSEYSEANNQVLPVTSSDEPIIPVRQQIKEPIKDPEIVSADLETSSTVDDGKA